MFAPMIKMCGYDAIFVQGVSEKPVYLYIGTNGPEIRDASKHWGMDATEAEDAIEADLWEPGRRKAIAYFRHLQRPGKDSCQRRQRGYYGLKEA